MPDLPLKAPRLKLQLIVIAAVMLVLMTLYEGAKQYLIPDISIWGSHTITIIFTTLLASITSFFILRRFHRSYQGRVAEINRRRATEEALRASEEKYRLLFEQSRDAIAIATSDGRFIDANPAYENLLGYRRDELMEMNAADMWCSREERQRWKETMEMNGFVTHYECRQRRKDDSEIMVQLTSTQRRDTTGRLIYQSSCRDISQRKRAEAERERLIADLQKALSEVKVLSGMLPICASCKRIRNDEGYWQQIESYISAHSKTEFSHGVCPECAHLLYPGFARDPHHEE